MEQLMDGQNKESLYSYKNSLHILQETYIRLEDNEYKRLMIMEINKIEKIIKELEGNKP